MSKFTYQVTTWPGAEAVRNATLDQLGLIRRWAEENPAPSGVQKLRIKAINERSEAIAQIKFSR